MEVSWSFSDSELLCILNAVCTIGSAAFHVLGNCGGPLVCGRAAYGRPACRRPTPDICRTVGPMCDIDPSGGLGGAATHERSQSSGAKSIPWGGWVCLGWLGWFDRKVPEAFMGTTYSTYSIWIGNSLGMFMSLYITQRPFHTLLHEGGHFTAWYCGRQTANPYLIFSSKHLTCFGSADMY